MTKALAKLLSLIVITTFLTACSTTPTTSKSPVADKYKEFVKFNKKLRKKRIDRF